MYDLHRLGWHNFQQLGLTIVREVWGQTVESYLDTNDGGRDGAFAGTWDVQKHEALSGRFIVQCKFTGKRDYNLQASDLSDELPKAQRLVAEGRCDCYLLITNAGVSGTLVETLEQQYQNVGVKKFHCFGSTWICEQIQSNKRLRMLVPRVYGLGDLTQILDERAYAQARALLASMREDLAKVVLTGAYARAAAALEQHGFVLLIGEPAAGKTTIASLLAMVALDQWDASPLKLDTPESLVGHWNPDEPSQFFWIDDAFGVTQYERHLVLGWNHAFAQIRAMLKQGARIVMTSRDYIYNRARSDLKEGAFPLLRESQVVIDVQKLDINERRQILYNHLRMGTQPRTFRTAIKPHLEKVASHERFLPETARRLADPLFTRGLGVYESDLLEYVERQESFLQEVIGGLDDASKAALALLYMRNDRLESPIELEEAERRSLERLGSSLGPCTAALRALDGSLVKHTITESESFWQFRHPTVGDAFARLLIRDPELLGIYVQGSSIEKLIRQVTCGDVGLENALILGNRFFSVIADRLDQMLADASGESRWTRRRDVDGFLARRCSRGFLSLYLDGHPTLLDRVARPGLMLAAVSEVDVAIRLHEVGLLPEPLREQFVSTVSEYAIDGEDTDALRSDSLRSVFNVDELEALKFRVRTELVPKLDDARYYWESNFGGSGQSPEDYIQPFVDTLMTLEELYPEDMEVETLVRRVRQSSNDWINEQEYEQPEELATIRRRRLTESATDLNTSGSRSIFEDVDE